MPKLVVVVEKDETGKLWDYAFTEADWFLSRKMLGDSLLRIHMAGCSVEDIGVDRTELNTEESVTFGLLPIGEEIKVIQKASKK